MISRLVPGRSAAQETSISGVAYLRAGTVRGGNRWSRDGETRAAARDASSWVLRHKRGNADRFDVIAVGIVSAPFPDDLGETKYQDTTGLAMHIF